jgi:hypothetical protein
MNRPARGLLLALALLVSGCLAAGCGSGGRVQNAISSFTASRSVTVSPPTLPSRTTAPAPTSAPAPAPSSQAPATSQAPAATPASTAASGTGSSLLWLWILLAALVVIIVAVLIARRSGRRSATTADWRSRTIDVYARGSALYDAMSTAEAPGALAAADAPARWADIQRRADDLTQQLYALRESARGEFNRARVEDVLGSLQAVRSAMGAERTQPGMGGPPSGRVHALLRDFEAALRELRDPSGQQL